VPGRGQQPDDLDVVPLVGQDSGSGLSLSP
jgi:hypothetical protein